MDFCVSSKEAGYYDNEIKTMGGKIFYSTPKSKNIFKAFKSIYDIVKSNNYKYVLRFSQNSMSSLELLAAKLAGAKVLAFRSTNSRTMKGGYENIIHFIFRPLVKIISNVKIAPSNQAAKFMFGNSKKVIILNNGIPLNDFAYDEKINITLRKQLGISKDCFVIGHIGRFNKQKNHKKIINIFNEIQQERPNSKLILVGKGELESEIRVQIKELKLEDKVIMLGIRNDVNKLLSVFDIFLFPSLYEGMPNTVIEAQANGIPCIVSNAITNEVKICENIIMIDPNKSDNDWSKICLSDLTRYKDDTNIVKLQKKGYNIDDVVEVFTNKIFEFK